MLRSLLVSLLLVGACSAGAPASPSPAPPTAGPTDAPSAAPTTAPTVAPAETATATPYCDPDYYDCDRYTPSPGTSTPAPVGEETVSVSESGPYLAGPNGLALYVFDNDSPDSSACNAGCADTWPALIVAEGETPSAGEGVGGTLTTFHRDDGSNQVAYDGRPLYYYVGDNQPTHTRGDGIGGVWHLAAP